VKPANKKTVRTSMLLGVLAIACGFAGETSFRLDVPSYLTVNDVAASEASKRTVVAANDGQRFYRDGVKERSLLTEPVDLVAFSSLTDQVWVHKSGGNFYRSNISNGKITGSALDTDDDVVADFAVAPWNNNEMFYFVGIYYRDHKPPQHGICRCEIKFYDEIDEFACGEWKCRANTPDIGGHVADPVAITVDESAGKVFVAEKTLQSDGYKYRISGYDLELHPSDQPSLVVPDVESMAADANILAVSGHDTRDGSARVVRLFYTGDDSDILFETDKQQISERTRIDGFALTDKCGQLWGASTQGSGDSKDLVLKRWEICKPK
jgi:hypothetical protein